MRSTYKGAGDALHVPTPWPEGLAPASGNLLAALAVPSVPTERSNRMRASREELTATFSAAQAFGLSKRDIWRASHRVLNGPVAETDAEYHEQIVEALAKRIEAQSREEV